MLAYRLLSSGDVLTKPARGGGRSGGEPTGEQIILPLRYMQFGKYLRVAYESKFIFP
jgi:hypothetical protein